MTVCITEKRCDNFDESWDCESPSKSEARNAREMIVKPLWNVCEMPARCLRQEESEKVERQTTERGQGVGLAELLTTYYKC